MDQQDHNGLFGDDGDDSGVDDLFGSDNQNRQSPLLGDPEPWQQPLDQDQGPILEDIQEPVLNDHDGGEFEQEEPGLGPPVAEEEGYAEGQEDEEEVEEEEGELEQEEGEDEAEAGEEELEESEMQPSQDRQKEKQIGGLLNDDEDEDDEDDEDNSEEDDEDDNEDDDEGGSSSDENGEKEHNPKAQQSKAQFEAQQPTQAQQNKRKRGRPSKKDKLEQEMQQRQERPQKRVRFENGDQVLNNEGEMSFENRSVSDGYREGEGGAGPDGRGGGQGAAGYRKELQDFEEYQKEMLYDCNKSSQFEIFTKKRRRQVYEQISDNPLEEERFNAYIEACPKKAMKKKLSDLIDQLPGQKLRNNELVIQVITSAVKSHAGQLIEAAKKIQIEEIKQRLALKFPHQALMRDGNGPILPEREFLVNGACLSKEAQETLADEIREMGPCLPHHLQEARRLMNRSEAAISDRPKSMFLRKRFR